mgnify:CR=1 FL=1
MLNGVNIGAEQVGSTLHWGPYWPYVLILKSYIIFLLFEEIIYFEKNDHRYNGYEKTTWPKNSASGYNKDFHLYQLEWTPSTFNLKLKLINKHH